MKADPIRVLLVDDHPTIRQEFSTLLLSFEDLFLAGIARSGAEALELCASVQPNVVLMDLLMPDMDGAEATRTICQRYPQVHVIILTRWEEYKLVKRALAQGAENYLAKNVSAMELAETIRSACTVQKPTPDSHWGSTVGLTPREIEVLDQIAKGLTNGQIALQMIVSRATVKYYVSNILNKMGACSRAEAAALGVQRHLVTGPGRN